MQRVCGAKVTYLTSGDLEACRVTGQWGRKALPEAPGVSRDYKSWVHRDEDLTRNDRPIEAFEESW